MPCRAVVTEQVGERRDLVDITRRPVEIRGQHVRKRRGRKIREDLVRGGARQAGSVGTPDLRVVLGRAVEEHAAVQAGRSQRRCSRCRRPVNESTGHDVRPGGPPAPRVDVQGKKTALPVAVQKLASPSRTVIRAEGRSARTGRKDQARCASTPPGRRADQKCPAAAQRSARNRPSHKARHIQSTAQRTTGHRTERQKISPQ